MTERTPVEVKAIEVGDYVKVVTETYDEADALVTCVHGAFTKNDHGYVPCINVVYVSKDDNKRDPNGRQIERYSSLQHFNSVLGMPKPGRYWVNQ